MATTPKKSTKPRMGRPTLYDPKYKDIVRGLAFLLPNITDDDIATALQVSKASVSNWKKLHPDFLEAIAGAKLPADAKVASALFQRALGYEYDEVQVVSGEEKGKSVSKKVVTRKHIPGDVTAQSLWLRNRRPTDWRTQPEVIAPEDSVPAPTTINVAVVDASRPKQDIEGEDA